jgi:hypothetical protein
VHTAFGLFVVALAERFKELDKRLAERTGAGPPPGVGKQA